MQPLSQSHAAPASVCANGVCRGVCEDFRALGRVARASWFARGPRRSRSRRESTVQPVGRCHPTPEDLHRHDHPCVTTFCREGAPRPSCGAKRSIWATKATGVCSGSGPRSFAALRMTRSAKGMPAYRAMAAPTKFGRTPCRGCDYVLGRMAPVAGETSVPGAGGARSRQSCADARPRSSRGQALRRARRALRVGRAWVPHREASRLGSPSPLA